MARELSAKDKAFEAERVKLRREIQKWKDAFYAADKALHAEEANTQEMEKEIVELATLLGYSKEELDEHIARAKKNNEMFSSLMLLKNFMTY